MSNAKSRILSLLLAVSLAIGMVSTTHLTVYAAPADDAAALANQINAYDWGAGTISATAVGATVTVEGATDGTPAYVNGDATKPGGYTLTMAPDVTVIWSADVTGPSRSGLGLLDLQGNGGTFILENCTITHTGSGYALRTNNNAINYGPDKVIISNAAVHSTDNYGMAISVGRPQTDVTITNSELTAVGSSVITMANSANGSDPVSTLSINGSTVRNTATDNLKSVIMTGRFTNIDITGSSLAISADASTIITGGKNITLNGSLLDLDGGLYTLGNYSYVSQIINNSNPDTIITVNDSTLKASSSDSFIFSLNNSTQEVHFNSGLLYTREFETVGSNPPETPYWHPVMMRSDYSSLLDDYSGDGVIIVLAQSAVGPFDQGTSDGLSAYPSGTTAVWDVQGGEYGISYKNDTTRGFLAVPETVIPDTTPPTVLGVSPSGEDVHIHGEISVTFDEEIWKVGTVSLNPPDGTPESGRLSADRLTYTLPYSGLDWDRPYTVTIKDFEDLVGNVMEQETHAFTTMKQPDGPYIQSTLTLKNGESKKVFVSLGHSGNDAAQATVIEPTGGAVRVTPPSLGQSGEIEVTGYNSGKSDITVPVAIDLSGGTYTGPGLSMSVTVLPDDEVLYNILVAPMQNGTVIPDKTAAAPGEIVNIRVVPDTGYRLKEGSLTVDGAVSVGSANGVINAFQMGTGNVTITAEFERIPTIRPSGSSGSDSSPDRSGIDYTATQSTWWIDENQAKSLADAANKENLPYVRYRSSGSVGIRANAVSALAGLQLELDTLDGNAVTVRISVPQPELLKEDTLLSGTVKGGKVDKGQALFEKWFQNNVRVVSLEQQSDWGQPMGVTAKVDLTGLDTDDLHFYSYDSATNTYRRIAPSNYWIDANGYLRFTTEYARDIIISEGALIKK